MQITTITNTALFQQFNSALELLNFRTSLLTTWCRSCDAISKSRDAALGQREMSNAQYTAPSNLTCFLSGTSSFLEFPKMNVIKVKIIQEPMNACNAWRGKTIELNWRKLLFFCCVAFHDVQAKAATTLLPIHSTN